MIKDKAGNTLYRSGNNIMLDLVKEDRRRKIGTLAEDDTLVIMRRNPEKHLLRVANAYGFCYEFLATAKKVKVVRILILGTKDFYHINVSDLLAIGDFLFFKKQGFEKQIFVTLEQLEKYGIKN